MSQETLSYQIIRGEISRGKTSTQRLSDCLTTIFARLLSQSLQASVRRRFPDITLLHQRDLSVEHFLFIVGVVARETIQVAIFGIDRLLVNNLGHLRADVF